MKKINILWIIISLLLIFNVRAELQLPFFADINPWIGNLQYVSPVNSSNYLYYDAVGILTFNSSKIMLAQSKQADGVYLYNDSSIMYFNETRLNATIDARGAGGGKTAYNPWLYEDLTYIYFNETKGDETYVNVDGDTLNGSLTINKNLTVGQDVRVENNVYITNNVNASNFYDDGVNLLTAINSNATKLDLLYNRELADNLTQANAIAGLISSNTSTNLRIDNLQLTISNDYLNKTDGATNLIYATNYWLGNNTFYDTSSAFLRVNGSMEFKDALGVTQILLNGSNGIGYYTGKLGIGETAPEGNLHLKVSDIGNAWSAAAADFLILERSGGGSQMDFRTDNNRAAGFIFSDTDARAQGIMQYNHATDKFNWATAGTNRMWLDSNGYLGIGTDSPSKELTVIGSANITKDLFINGAADFNRPVNINGRLALTNMGSGAFSVDFVDGATITGNEVGNFFFSDASNQFISGSREGDMGFRAMGGNFLIGAGTARGVTPTLALIVTNTSYVGIGTLTTIPTSKFQIGTGTVSQQWADTTNPYVYIQGVNNDGGVNTTALQISDENLNNMLQVSSIGDNKAGKVVVGGNLEVAGNSDAPYTLSVIGKSELVSDVDIGFNGPQTKLRLGDEDFGTAETNLSLAKSGGGTAWINFRRAGNLDGKIGMDTGENIVIENYLSGRDITINPSDELYIDGTTHINGNLNVSVDAVKEGAYIGELFAGYLPLSTNWVGLQHSTLLGSKNNYGIALSRYGDTFINAKSGRSIRLRINNVDAMLVDKDRDIYIAENLIIGGTVNATGDIVGNGSVLTSGGGVFGNIVYQDLDFCQVNNTVYEQCFSYEFNVSEFRNDFNLEANIDGTGLSGDCKFYITDNATSNNNLPGTTNIELDDNTVTGRLPCYQGYGSTGTVWCNLASNARRYNQMMYINGFCHSGGIGGGVKLMNITIRHN